MKGKGGMKAVDAMKSLSRVLERQYAQGFEMVIGLDESGRGPLAGPVVAAACYIPFDAEDIPGIADSKLLSEEQREDIFAVLTAHPRISYAASVVSHSEIDEINILQASLRGMARACHDVLEQLGQSPQSTQTIALVDGNKLPAELQIEKKFVVQGDRHVYSIAAASVIAKVTRDRLMLELDRQFPQYNFAQHKGYPTPEHRALLARLGPCEVHRRSYAPVRQAMLAHAPVGADADAAQPKPKSAAKMKKAPPKPRAVKKSTVAQSEEPPVPRKSRRSREAAAASHSEGEGRKRTRPVAELTGPPLRRSPRLHT